MSKVWTTCNDDTRNIHKKVYCKVPLAASVISYDSNHVALTSCIKSKPINSQGIVFLLIKNNSSWF